MFNFTITRSAILSCGAFLLSSCAAVTHVAPTSGPTADIRFATNMEFGSSVRRFDDKQCKVNPKELARLRVGYLLNSSEKRLGIPGIKAFHKNAAQELVIRAEKEFTYLVTGSNVSGSTTYSCAVPFSLKAKAGQKLEVSFSSNSGIVCRVTVSEITGGTAEKAIRKPIGTYTNLLSKGYEGCSEAFNNPPLF